MTLKTFLNKALRCIEHIWSSNWYNPFATLWLNFRCFPLRQAVHLPVLVYGRPRLYELEGRMRIEGTNPRFGLIRFNRAGAGSPGYCGSQSVLVLRGEIIFRGAGQIDTGCKIIVEYNATLDLGNHFKITDEVNLCAALKIVLGNSSWIVHRCQVFDSNFHYVADLNKNVIPREMRPIIIGNNCWICNSSTVTGGTVLPDFTIVGSNSLVNRNYSDLPPYSLIAGCPAKFIKSGVVRVDNPSIISAIWPFYKHNPNAIYAITDGVIPEDLVKLYT